MVAVVTDCGERVDAAQQPAELRAPGELGDGLLDVVDVLEDVDRGDDLEAAVR